MAKGGYRGVDWVRVDYDGKPAIPMLRGIYEEQNYGPAYDELPTKEQYHDSKYRLLLDEFTISIYHLTGNVTEH